jgi:hypothetical protein
MGQGIRMTIHTGVVFDVYFEDNQGIVMLCDPLDIIHKIYCDTQMLSHLIDDQCGLIGHRIEYDDQSNHLYRLTEGN